MPSSTKSLFHFKCFNEIFLKYIKQDYMKEFYLSRNCMCMLYHTFFFPPELCSMNSILIPLGKFVRSTWMGVLRTIILSEVLLPYFLHLQKILRPDLLEKAKAQSAWFWVCVCERWCGCVERTPAWEFGVWVSSLFEQVSSSLVKVKVLVIQLCPTLDDPMDRSKPGSSVHEIL